MNEIEYNSIGLTIRRSGKAFALYRVYIFDGTVVCEELIQDHRTLPSACRLGEIELRGLHLGLNRKKYELPELATHKLKVG